MVVLWSMIIIVISGEKGVERQVGKSGGWDVIKCVYANFSPQNRAGWMVLRIEFRMCWVVSFLAVSCTSSWGLLVGADYSGRGGWGGGWCCLPGWQRDWEEWPELRWLWGPGRASCTSLCSIRTLILMLAGSKFCCEFFLLILCQCPPPFRLHIPATVCLTCRCTWWINPSYLICIPAIHTHM